MTVFKEFVEHHINDEESKVVKSAEKALGHPEIQNIMRQFEQDKQKIKKNMKQPGRSQQLTQDGRLKRHLPQKCGVS